MFSFPDLPNSLLRYLCNCQNWWGSVIAIFILMDFHNISTILNLDVVMDSSFWFDTINLEWSIVYIEW